MLHAVIDLDADGHAGIRRAIAEPRGVVAQHLLASRVHHDRREILEVGEHRRGIGIAGIAALQIMPRADEQQFPGQRSIAAGVLQHAPARQREVRQRRHGHAGGRHRQTGIADRQQHRESKPAARAVARHDDRLRRNPARHELAVGVDAVAHRRRKHVFRRQPVGGGKRRRFGGVGQLGDQSAMGFGRARDVSAAVEIQDQPIRRRRIRTHPLALDRPERGGFEHRVARDRAEAIRQIGPLPAQFGDVGVGIGRAGLGDLAELAKKTALPAGHDRRLTKEIGPGLSAGRAKESSNTKAGHLKRNPAKCAAVRREIARKP